MSTEPAGGRTSGSDCLDSDTQLAIRLREHSPAALAEVYWRHGSAVVEHARRFGQPDAADDVAQEVFVALWRNPGRFDATRGSLRTYLLAQVHNRSIDMYRSEQCRRRRQDRFCSTPEARPSPDDTVVAADQAAHVRASLDDLPSDERVAIDLAYFGHHSYREVAQLLGQPEGTVKSRIRHGLQTIRSAMKLAEAVSS
ncbi:MAG: sigma-70 family RNA polymerase sigma factor [Actinomycetota bacterium]|nr:sigma-70 family RNA polymerase sigma factor [Actinomycetota bacterium]MDQ6945821.1 sigma-70 family RNA polymerase sigma factor [Actinomycetota bacterium]